jgi:hypothetical protein
MATDETTSNPYFGIFYIFLAWLVWNELPQNPFDELTLIREAKVAKGSLYETFENEAEDERGQVFLSDVGIYHFNGSNGTEYKAHIIVPTGQLAENVEIEYLSENPEINRVKGDGCQTFFEWVWRKFLLGGLIIGGLFGFGVLTIWNFLRKRFTSQKKA